MLRKDLNVSDHLVAGTQFIFLHTVYGCFPATMVKLSNCKRDHTPAKPLYLAIYRNVFTLNPDQNL